MNIFVCLFLIPLVSCSAERILNAKYLTKRGLDHNSNLALVNLNIANKPVDQPPGIVNVASPEQGSIPVTVNTDALALGNSNALGSGQQFAYAQSFPQNLPLTNIPLENNILYFQQAPIAPGQQLLGNVNVQNVAVNAIQDDRNIPQSYAPNFLPQNYPIQLIREVKVPQPYPVHITRTIQVPVHVRVPVEVPKPYAVKVPHPVPVPVHIKVPVTVEKPYPVQVTKTIAVPVEKPVYIRVPQPIQVPVPQPYPVAVPQPVQIAVPFVVRLPESQPNLGDAQGQVLSNFGAGIAQNLLPTAPLQTYPGSLGVDVPQNIGDLQQALAPSTQRPLLPTPSPLPQLNAIGDVQPPVYLKPQIQVNVTSSSPLKPKLPVAVTGNGLLPPRPTSNRDKLKLYKGLLSSYVSSREGGVFRRSTEYQTQDYVKTW